MFADTKTVAEAEKIIIYHSLRQSSNERKINKYFDVSHSQEAYHQKGNRRVERETMPVMPIQ